MLRGIIYVRVSSDEQVKGMSLDFQKQDCLAYAGKKSIEIDRMFEERGESAKFADRPSLIELLDYCRKHKSRINVLIIWKLDRLSRNQLDYYYLKRTLRDLGIDILSATEPSLDDSSSIAGKIFETFSALQAEIDNTIRSERARRGLEAKVASGINPWIPPPGYRRDPNRRHGDKKLTPDVPDPASFPIIQAALREYATGNLTQADLVRLLNERGFAEVRGHRIYPQEVNRMLTRHLQYYRGYLVCRWSAQAIKGQHVPMISEEEYRRIVAIREGRTLGRSVRRRRDHPLFPLRRLIICADCHSFYTASLSRGKTKRFPYYRCVSKGCPAYGKSLPKADVEQAFAVLLARYTLTEDYLDRLQTALSHSLGEVNAIAQRKVELCDRRLAELEERKRRINEMREDGSYTKDEYIKRKTELEIDFNEVLVERNEQRILMPDLDQVFDYAKRFILTFGRQWTEMPMIVRREFQNIVFPDGIEYRRNFGFGTPNVGPIFKLFVDDFLKSAHLAGRVCVDWNSIMLDLRKIAELFHLLE